jgi:hypothetical protein
LETNKKEGRERGWRKEGRLYFGSITEFIKSVRRKAFLLLQP